MGFVGSIEVLATQEIVDGNVRSGAEEDWVCVWDLGMGRAMRLRGWD